MSAQSSPTFLNFFISVLVILFWYDLIQHPLLAICVTSRSCISMPKKVNMLNFIQQIEISAL